MSSSVVQWCFLAVLLTLTGFGGSSSADNAVRSYGVCTSTDTPSMCLFKALLKNALQYMSRRNDGGGGTVSGPGGTLQQSKGIEDFLLEQIQNLIGMFSFGFELPSEVTAPWSLLKSSFFDGRGKKNKNLGPMLAAGVAVMAGTLVPLAFGALFMLAGKAIMTSMLAITISGLLGLKTLFGKSEGGHVKAYTAPPAGHYSEAQFEQELGIYKGQTEAKMHNSASNYYSGESNLSAYYNKGDPQSNGSNQPEYYATGANVSPKFTAVIGTGSGGETNKIVVERND